MFQFSIAVRFESSDALETPQPRISKPALGFLGLIVRTLLVTAIFAASLLIESADAQAELMTAIQNPWSKVIFLDVDETLLDLEPLKESVTKALD